MFYTYKGEEYLLNLIDTPVSFFYKDSETLVVVDIFHRDTGPCRFLVGGFAESRSMRRCNPAGRRVAGRSGAEHQRLPCGTREAAEDCARAEQGGPLRSASFSSSY